MRANIKKKGKVLELFRLEWFLAVEEGGGYGQLAQFPTRQIVFTNSPKVNSPKFEPTRPNLLSTNLCVDHLPMLRRI